MELKHQSTVQLFHQCHKKHHQTSVTGWTFTLRPHKPGCGCNRAQSLSVAAGPGTLLSASPPAEYNHSTLIVMDCNFFFKWVQSLKRRKASDSSSFTQTSCIMWAIALDLSRTWRDIILSKCLSRCSKLFQSGEERPHKVSYSVKWLITHLQH